MKVEKKNQYMVSDRQVYIYMYQQPSKIYSTTNVDHAVGLTILKQHYLTVIKKMNIFPLIFFKAPYLIKQVDYKSNKKLHRVTAA